MGQRPDIKEYTMKKLARSSELLWVFGVVFVALGVAFCGKADLGVSMIAAPVFVLCEALNPVFPWLTVGMTEYFVQGILLVILCLAVQKANWRYLLAFAVAVIYGLVLDLMLLVVSPIVVNTTMMRWVLLFVGDLFVAFGVACFFRTYLPLQIYELFVAEFSSRYRLPLGKVKWCFDIVLFILSAVLALTLFGDAGTFDWSQIGSHAYHSIGLGTIVTMIINTPLITLMGKLVDRLFDDSARFKKLEKLLKR